MSSSSCASTLLRAWRNGNGNTASLAVNIASAGRKMRFQPREQARHLPAMRRHEVPVGAGWAVDQSFEAQSAQIVVIWLEVYSVWLRPNRSATWSRKSALWKPSMRCWNRVRARNRAITRGCPNFSAGDFLPSAGWLHHALDAVAAQPAVLAAAFDFEQSPVDLAADFRQVG